MKNENETAKRTKMVIPMVLIGLICFLGGLEVQTSNFARGARPSAELTLGASAGEAIKAIGAPIKISYDTGIQTWFYRGADKTTTKRLILNQGVVVRIF